MSYTLAQMKTALQDYSENDETTFVTHLDDFIKSSEEKILKKIKLDVFRKNSTGSLTINNAYLNKPSDYLASFSLSVTVSGVKTFLLMKDVNLVQEYNSGGSTGIPKYYAPFDIENFIVSPTPDSGYTVEIHYFRRPESLVDVTADTLTWISTNAPFALLFGALIEAATYMKLSHEEMQPYIIRHQESLQDLQNLGEGRENTDSYRNPSVT